ncbi:MAG: DUF362 domain-containing protein [Acidimicrobiales bacterium]
MLVESFLTRHAERTGPIVIKTSTAKKRERNHEPDDRILESIFGAVRERYPDRELLLADGPAFAADFIDIAEHHRWTELAERHHATVVDLNTEPAKPMLDGNVFVATLCAEAAFTISVGKAKTHRRTGISGAEKASIDYLSGSEMGYPKLERRHYLLPAIYRAIQAIAAPTLHIVDGINAIEGNGPMNGRPTDSEFILVGEDPVAIDIQLSRIFSFDPALVISLFHSLEPAPVATTLLTTERSRETMRRFPVKPPKEQPWLYRSLRKQGSRRNRRNFAKIQKAFADVHHS